MLSSWVSIGLYLPKEHQRVFAILLVCSSESNDSSLGQLSFTGSLETQDLCMYGSSFAKSEKYPSSEVSLYSVLLFSFSKEMFISQDFDIFMMKLDLSSKFVFSFLILLDILDKKTLSTIVFFLNAMKSVIRKRLMTFYLRNSSQWRFY